MKTYTLPHTDLVVSRLAFGCFQLLDCYRHLKDLSASQSADAVAKAARAISAEPLSQEDLERASRLVHTAVDAGITLFDHADIYGVGKCEAAFGEVLKQSPGLRERIVIQTKCGNRLPETPQPNNPFRFDCRDNSSAHIIASAEGSLRRLNTDRIDIFLLHVADVLVRPEEVAAAFDALERSGKVRYFGVSNHSGPQIDRLRGHLLKPLVANQIHLSLADAKRIMDPTVDYCATHGLQIQAYSPLRPGSLKLPNLLHVADDAPPAVRQAATLLADIARTKNAAPAAVALAWLMHHPAGIVPVIGAVQSEHVLENCTADDIQLSREEWYGLLAAGTAIAADPQGAHS